MGTTPNRGYPYPDLTSPVDFPGDLQALAEAFDTDLKAVQDTVETRPMFRATSTAQDYYGTLTTYPLEFDTLSANTSGAVSPVITPGQTTFTPLITGYWEFTATITYPARSGVTWATLNLLAPGATEIAGSTVSVFPSSGSTATLSVSGTAFMTGGSSTVSAVLSANVSGATWTWPLYTRSLTGILLART